MGGFLALLIAGLIVIGAVYAGWNTGLATARALGTSTTGAYARQQCQLIAADLAAGSLRLARSRIDDLAKLRQTPACLPMFAPTATAAARSAASPRPTLPASPTPAPPTIAPSPTLAQPTVRAQPLATATTLSGPDDGAAARFDLEALLAEAQAAMTLSDYPAAIDTLDAIISIDPDFQRELTRGLILEALTARALALYRGGRLSEAIVMTDRAEEHGSIDELNHERFIALLYLDGQRLKTANPAEAARKFSRLYHEYGLRDYVNGPIAADLQEAQRNYAMALALQGEHCPAQAQFQAALDLQPAYSRVNLADLRARRDQSQMACQAGQPNVPAEAATQPALGARAGGATPAPVGYQD